MSKFSAEIPKGDGWGVEAIVADAVKKIQMGQKSPLIPVIGVIDIKEIKVDPETHNVVAVVRVRRLEGLDTIERIRAAQKILLEQAAARKGEGTTLPFEEAELINRAFGGLDIAQIEQDEREAKEDEGLSEIDRLRRHLNVVHGMAVDDNNPDHEVTRAHDLEHERIDREISSAIQTGSPEPTDGHDPDWWAWRRVDLEAATAEDPEDEPAAADEGVLPFDPDRPDADEK